MRPGRQPTEVSCEAHDLSPATAWFPKPSASRGWLEIRTGVHVGEYSPRTRERIWDQVLGGIEAGDAVMVWSAPNDQGFDFATTGQNRRMPEDFDGLKLIKFSSQNR